MSKTSHTRHTNVLAHLPWRGRGDAQPTAEVAVVLASLGRPLSAEAIDTAARLAEDGDVAVVSIARIHGSAFGLQHPGLMPTRQEREEQMANVEAALRALRRRRVTADGQVAVTRNPGRTIARIARIRAARHVVMDHVEGGRLRRLFEGGHLRGVRRRLRSHAALWIVDTTASTSQEGGTTSR